MMAAMAAAGIVMPDAAEAALKVAGAPPSAPAACDDPDCGVDHDHAGHDHGHGHHAEQCDDPTHDHSHGHKHGHEDKEKGADDHKGHDHGHGHGHEDKKKGADDHKGHDHGHGHEDNKKGADDHKGHDHGHGHSAAAASASVSAVGPITISAELDSGNIMCDDVSDPTGKGVQLRVKHDVFTELEKKAHGQWFHFKCSGVSDGSAGPLPTKFVITNVNECSFPSAWPNSTVCASFTRGEDWFRCLDTVYDKAAGTLSWTFDAKTHPGSGAASTVAYFAYFAPYSWERHEDLVAKLAASPLVTHSLLGKTCGGRDLDLLTVGGGPSKAWVIGRQHPGEPQAEWYTEGLLERLSNPNDALARKVRELFTFYVVPNMNPDGSVMGHLRCNAKGQNLNREWANSGVYAAPTLERSPEVWHCLAAMDATGVDFFVDVHGDEEIPMNFVSGMEGLPAWGPRMEALQGAFVNSYARANPDMQGGVSYEPEPPKEANLAMCSNQVAHRFNCLGVTFEQPFKDCATNPDPELGWSPKRCKALGASLIDVAHHCQPYLRAEGPFWETMDKRDAYERPKEGSCDSV